jgi:hypothetical protein
MSIISKNIIPHTSPQEYLRRERMTFKKKNIIRGKL